MQFKNPMAKFLNSDSDSDSDGEPAKAVTGGGGGGGGSDSDSDEEDSKKPSGDEKLTLKIATLNDMLDRAKFKNVAQKEQIDSLEDELQSCKSSYAETKNQLEMRDRLVEDLQHELRRLKLVKTQPDTYNSKAKEAVQVAAKISLFQSKIRIAGIEDVPWEQKQQEKRDKVQAAVARKQKEQSEQEAAFVARQANFEAEQTTQRKQNETQQQNILALEQQLNKQRDSLHAVSDAMHAQKQKELEDALQKLQSQKKEAEDRSREQQLEKERFEQELKAQSDVLRQNAVKLRIELELQQQESEKHLEEERLKMEEQVQAIKRSLERQQSETEKVHLDDITMLQCRLSELLEASETRQRLQEEAEEDYKKQILRLQEYITKQEEKVEQQQKEIATTKKDLTAAMRDLRTVQTQLEDERAQAITAQASMKTTSNSLKEGYLFKRGKNLSKWMKRWVVLTSHEFSYFSSPELRTRKGLLQLDISSLYGAVDFPERRDFSFVIVPKPGGRRYMFAASTAAERTQWLEALANTSATARSLDAMNALVLAQPQADVKFDPIYHSYLSKFVKSGKGLQRRHFALYPGGILKWGETAVDFHAYKNSSQVVECFAGESAYQHMKNLGATLTAAHTPERLFVVQTSGKVLCLMADSEEQVMGWLTALISATGAEPKGQNKTPLTGQLLKYTHGGKKSHKKFFVIRPDGQVQWGDNAQKLKHQALVTALVVKGSALAMHTDKLSAEQRQLFFALQTTGKELLLLAPSQAAYDAWVKYAAEVVKPK